MIKDASLRCDSRDSFISFFGENGLMHISWLINDKQLVFFEKESSQDSNTSLSVCSVQEYCRAILKNKTFRSEYISKEQLFKLIDLVEF